MNTFRKLWKLLKTGCNFGNFGNFGNAKDVFLHVFGVRGTRPGKAQGTRPGRGTRPKRLEEPGQGTLPKEPGRDGNATPVTGALE